MFRADGKHNSVRKRSGPIRLRLVDEVRNARPALALARRLRGVLRKALEEAHGGGLEVLDDVLRGGRVRVRRELDDVDAGERERGCVVGVNLRFRRLGSGLGLGVVSETNAGGAG